MCRRVSGMEAGAHSKYHRAEEPRSVWRKRWNTYWKGEGRMWNSFEYEYFGDVDFTISQTGFGIATPSSEPEEYKTADMIERGWEVRFRNPLPLYCPEMFSSQFPCITVTKRSVNRTDCVGKLDDNVGVICSINYRRDSKKYTPNDEVILLPTDK